jgi:8-oxo-dGTP pyrophosphatase MutT (NUDIX family)
MEKTTITYSAAGGVVFDGDLVLVLGRPARNEVRLPKGHIEPGETPLTAALREIAEESGCRGLRVVSDLGQQVVEFQANGRRIVRTERFFLVEAQGSSIRGLQGGEEQFDPLWLPWGRALEAVTFETEREWVRRGRKALKRLHRRAGPPERS